MSNPGAGKAVLEAKAAGRAERDAEIRAWAEPQVEAFGDQDDHWEAGYQSALVDLLAWINAGDVVTPTADSDSVTPSRGDTDG